MPWEEELEVLKQDKAARVIQQAWKSFLVSLFRNQCFHTPNHSLQDHSGWYRRIENNGWRPVSDTFWLSTDSIVVEDKKESEFHFSKLKRRQDLEKKRKLRKIEWMRQMYYSGSLEAKSTHRETLGLIHTATKGLIRAFEDGGIDSVMEWEVDEVLNWTNTLNFDEYIASWKEIATSNSSANFKGIFFRILFRIKMEYKFLSSPNLANVNTILLQ
uniref:Chromosome 11 open reading frame 65 n=1 Tax=Mandrillus leucophaeus TaxID=9568 RepID=A0A2K5Z9K4_MANLE